MIIPYPFRGDTYLLQTVNRVMRQDTRLFVETGSFYGITTAYMAKAYPDIQVASCEIHPDHYKYACEETSTLPNCLVVNQDSEQFLMSIVDDWHDKPAVFWLDAHGYGFPWPLLREIEIISQRWKSAYMFVDDFLVPGRPWFEYDEYNGQQCSYAYIKDALGDRPHQLWYPCYKPPVGWRIRGWCLLTFNASYDPDSWIDRG